MIEVDIYDGTNPTALIATLSESRDRNWLDQLTDTGSGGFRLHDDDTIFGSSPDVLAYGNIARFKLDGTDRFASLIETRNLSPASPEEKAGLWWEINGRGVLALLADAIVYPEIVADGDFSATLTGQTQRQRQFDFTAIQYDDSNWTAATQIYQQSDHTAGPGRWGANPEGWPNPNAFWIWSRDLDANNSHPLGTSYFRRTFEVDPSFDGNEAIIYASCDNAYMLYLDGEQILEGDSWRDMQSVRKRLSQGLHAFAAVCTNVPNISGDANINNPAGFILTAYELDDDGNLSDELVATEGSWLCLDYPTAVPGMTLGEILRILLDEAQSRGALQGVTWTFTDVQDSNSAAWTAGNLIDGIFTLDVALDIGMNYLDVIRTLMEQWADVRMSPSLVLDVYNKGTFGSDLSSGTSLLVGEDFEDLSEAGEEHTTNSVLVRDTTGVLSLQEDSGSLAVRKRKEVYLEFALAPTEERAQQMASEIVVEFGTPTIAATATVDVDSGVYTGWGVADTIKLPDTHGNAVEATVTSIAVSEDEVGHPIFVVEGMMFDENL